MAAKKRTPTKRAPTKKPPTKRHSTIRFLESERAKLVLVLVTFLIALVLTGLLLDLFPVDPSHIGEVLSLVVWFPLGLLTLLEEYRLLPAGLGGGILFLVWAGYFVISLVIIETERPRLRFVLYAVLIFLLVANARGCTLVSY